MKKTLAFLLVAFSFAVILYSCKKESAPTPTPTTTVKTPTPKKEYEKRWNVSSFQRSASDTTLVSIELTMNTYFLYFSDGTTVTGSFTETNDSTLNLIDYGVLTINSISSSNFGFTLTTSSGTLRYSSAAAPVIASSANTTALCNTWKVVKMTENDTVYQFKPNETLFVTFSQYGSYLTKSSYSADSVEYGVNAWMWTDSNENAFCYGDWNGTNITSCDGLFNVSVSFSLGNSHCTIKETYTDSVYSYKGVYELEVQ